MPPQLTEADVQDLHFDPENPRLPDRLKGAPDPEVIKYLLHECNLIDLMLSIGEQNFFAGEPLLVVPRAEGGLTVVEGNRRLGALKLLQPGAVAPVMPTQVAQANASATHHPTRVPVLKFVQRDEILTYLGYRHITGIQEWDALAKARYLRQLRLRYGPAYSETEAHKALAREIGSRASHVAKLLTGLTLLERARDSGILHEIKLREDDIPFSLLTTGIGYENICKFIGLKSGSDVEAAGLKDKEFKEFFTWVFAKPLHSKTVLGESRNFDKLARVVAHERAYSELQRGASLDDADLYTSGPLEALRKLMNEAESRISSAQTTLSYAEGLDSNDLTQAERIRKATVALHGAIQGLINPTE